MTVLLALDPGGLCGFAVGELGGQPRWGTHALGRGLSTGEALSGFACWLRDLIADEAPGICCFESPYVPMLGAEIPRNAATVRRLHCYAGMIEAVCWRQQIEVYEARPSEIAKFFLGNAKQGGRANKKAATIKMCRLYGWVTTSDDAADALSLWAYAEHTIAPRIGSQRHASAGRELPLHGMLHPP